MIYLWNELKDIKEYVNRQLPLIIFLDFDGTLAPIQKLPDDAKLPSKTRDLLLSLSKKKNIILAIISGRQLDDLKEKIGISDLIYGGNYGLESENKNHRFSLPVSNLWGDALERIKSALKKLSLQYPGAFLEDKNVAVSFHYRNIDNQLLEYLKDDFVKTMRPFESVGEAKIIPGKKVYDIHPNINSGKQYFARETINIIIKKNKIIPSTIFIGDDNADEAAFRILKKGINIKVGKKEASVANYYLNDSQDVFKFLSWLENQYEYA